MFYASTKLFYWSQNDLLSNFYNLHAFSECSWTKDPLTGQYRWNELQFDICLILLIRIHLLGTRFWIYLFIINRCPKSHLWPIKNTEGWGRAFRVSLEKWHKKNVLFCMANVVDVDPRLPEWSEFHSRVNSFLLKKSYTMINE